MFFTHIDNFEGGKWLHFISAKASVMPSSGNEQGGKDEDKAVVQGPARDFSDESLVDVPASGPDPETLGGHDPEGEDR